nr:MAG TPA: hypothetical protein [Caudoviricetes sp.]
MNKRNKLVTHTLGNIVFSGVLILLCNERGELNRVQFLCGCNHIKT